MKIARVLITTLFIAGIASAARAQSPCPSEKDEVVPPAGKACLNAQNLGIGGFGATPLIDGTGSSYGDPDGNLVSLYGIYGNNESTSLFTAAQAHYQQGVTLAANIKALCHNGTAPGAQGCTDGTVNPAIVFLFIGMSNVTLEAGGGTTEAWPHDINGMLTGQPCSSLCPNLNNKGGTPPWNQVSGDPAIQQSLLYQVYPPVGNSLVGRSVVVWNGAQEGETLPQWDPSSDGYYNSNMCAFTQSDDPECNYKRVKQNLMDATGNGNTGGYTEAQVQAIFIKAADKFPACDLNLKYCNAPGTLPDAYQMETYLGNIVRYLKCCELSGVNKGLPRYPNLQQVFITSRIYGGYANGQPPHGGTQPYDCENPEPFAYEGGFGVQRLIVDQINQVALYPGPVQYDYAGEVDYTVAPWIDWGPYLWASGSTQRQPDLLNWCNGQSNPPCDGEYDVREGDPLDQTDYWGDFTHPTAKGISKVANLLVNFMNPLTGSSWLTPWIGK